MRVLVQRVTEASVAVDGAVIGRCGKGFLLLACAMKGDDLVAAHKAAEKISKMRIFPDENGKTNLSIKDVGGSALVVSQFTLSAETKGNRPGFSRAADPATGKELYEAFAARLAELEIPTQTGEFGADMKVSLVNDGPFTIWLDTDA